MMESPRWSQAEEAYDGDHLIEDALREGVRPDPVISVSEWADRYRILSTKIAAEAGPYRTGRVPFMRGVMDALSPTDPARKIVFMKGAQVGATEVGSNWIGYIIHWQPAPAMVVWPTVDMAKKNSKLRVGELIAASPELSAIVGGKTSKDASNTVLMKEFPGGVLSMTGANSGVGLRSMPARFIFADEVDAYPGDVDGEGDPIALLTNRTTTFGRNAKLFLVSTPTVHGDSRIEREFELTDQRRFFVPCPHCGGMQWLKFQGLRWTWGEPETVVYYCEHCEEPIEERHKAEMLPAGEWMATAEPKEAGAVGFHISALYSPLGWFSWAQMAQEWESAQGDVDKLKAFKNTRLGETWHEATEQVDWERLYERREHWKPGTLPAGVTIVTAAVDVQASPARLEAHVWGWGVGLESWMIEKRVFFGRADDMKTWAGVDEMLTETWTHESGAELAIEVLTVDTGDQTTDVYAWISKQDQQRVLAVKGKAGYDINAPVASPTNIPFGARRKAIRLRSVHGDVFKAEFYRFLGLSKPDETELAANGYPPGYVHIPDFMDSEWCKQAVGEQRIRKKTTGKFEWVKKHIANEALDCRVYARAGLWCMGVAAWKPERWAKLREIRALDSAGPAPKKQIAGPASQPPVEPPPPPPPPRHPTGWLGGRGGSSWLRRS